MGVLFISFLPSKQVAGTMVLSFIWRSWGSLSSVYCMTNLFEGRVETQSSVAKRMFGGMMSVRPRGGGWAFKIANCRFPIANWTLPTRTCPHREGTSAHSKREEQLHLPTTSQMRWFVLVLQSMLRETTVFIGN
jgi:hypothetical protein